MAALLKSFAKGLLYLVVLPGLLVILAFYSVAGVVMFIYRKKPSGTSRRY